MTHGTGGADAIPPFIARRRIKDVAERPYQTQTPLVLDQPRAQGLWGERFVLVLRISTARGTRAGTGRELQGCHSTGMKSCQEWQCQYRTQNEWHHSVEFRDKKKQVYFSDSTYTDFQGLIFQSWVEEFFPFIVWEKLDPKIFSTQGVTFLSPSFFRGTLGMENWIDAEPMVMNCDCC